MARNWDAEVEVDEELATRLIEAQFPALAPATLQLIGQGFDNTVYRANGRWVFRFPRRSIALELLASELALLPAIGELALPLAIPRPVFAGRPSEAYAWPFAGYEDVPGETPGALGAARRASSAETLAVFLRELHRFPASRALALGAPRDRHERLNAPLRHGPLLERLAELRGLGLWRDERLWRAFEGHWAPLFAELAAPEAEEELVFAHGDLHFRNMVMNKEGRLTGIIDWGDLHVGHRAIDLQVVYGFLPPEGRSAFFRIYGNCSGRTLLLARFRAVVTSAALAAYAHDLGDSAMADAAWECLADSLSE